MERRVPTKDEVLAYLKEDRNWGRWGNDDQKCSHTHLTIKPRWVWEHYWSWSSPT